MQHRHSIHLPMSALLCFFAIAMNPSAEDWPQYQGPERNGISPETGLAREWPEAGPKTIWSHPLGEGFGGPAIRDGKVYLLDRLENARDVLRCFDLNTGEALWEFSYDAPGEVSHNGSRATPTVTATHVYSVGMTGMMQCIDLATHKSAWSINLAEKYPTVALTWGYAQSPLIYGDNVIVAPQSDEGFVVALDQSSGEEVWKSESLGKPGYSSPVIANIAGIDQVVMLATGRPGGVSGLSAKDGSTLWNFNDWRCRIPIPYATPVGSNRLFLTGEYGAGSAMIEIEKKGDAFAAKEIYATDECGSQIHQPLLFGDHFYANSNGNSRNDGMICMSIDGKLLWRTRDVKDAPRFERGGLIMADGLIISLDGKRGTIHLIEPSPEGYRELASAPAVDGGRSWAPMALSNGKLVLRSQTELKCLDLKNP